MKREGRVGENAECLLCLDRLQKYLRKAEPMAQLYITDGLFPLCSQSFLLAV